MSRGRLHYQSINAVMQAHTLLLDFNYSTVQYCTPPTDRSLLNHPMHDIGCRWGRKNEIERPYLLELYNCTDVEVADVTLRDSATWTLHPVYSARVHIHHVTIDAPASSPNTDVSITPRCNAWATYVARLVSIGRSVLCMSPCAQWCCARLVCRGSTRTRVRMC